MTKFEKPNIDQVGAAGRRPSFDLGSLILPAKYGERERVKRPLPGGWLHEPHGRQELQLSLRVPTIMSHHHHAVWLEDCVLFQQLVGPTLHLLHHWSHHNRVSVRQLVYR